MIEINNETVFSCCNGCGCQLGDIKRIQFSSDNGSSGITVQLCKECREELVKLIDPLCYSNFDESMLRKLTEDNLNEAIKARVKKSMNDGKAYWFSQSNIEDLTFKAIKNMVDEEFVKEITRKFDIRECRELLSRRLADCILDQMGYED